MLCNLVVTIRTPQQMFSVILRNLLLSQFGDNLCRFWCIISEASVKFFLSGTNVLENKHSFKLYWTFKKSTRKYFQGTPASVWQMRVSWQLCKKVFSVAFDRVWRTSFPMFQVRVASGPWKPGITWYLLLVLWKRLKHWSLPKNNLENPFSHPRFVLLITWFTVIDIAQVTVLLCNCPLFCNCPLTDWKLPAVEKY